MCKNQKSIMKREKEEMEEEKKEEKKEEKRDSLIQSLERGNLFRTRFW